MYDAIIVGARCAGAATAVLLARAGHRVLMVDRSRFPSDMPRATRWTPRSGTAAPPTRRSRTTGAAATRPYCPAGLRNDPALTERFFGVFAGTVPVADPFEAPAAATAT